MGSEEDRKKFVGQVLKGCHIAAKFREMGVRPHGVVRIDSASSVTEWDRDPEGSTKRIAETFRQACDVAEDFGERLAAEGEICWGGMHSWKAMLKLLETVDRPKTLGFQADMAHTLLYTMGYNAPEDAILPADYDWQDRSLLGAALTTLTAALRPWTIDFHVAQNDATVKGSGSHDKTGRHCLADDPNGKLDIAHDAGYWMRDAKGKPTKAFRHICWDGCMFPNEVMMKPQTWNDILAAMVAVRDAHGWSETKAPASKPSGHGKIEVTKRSARPVARKTKPAKPARKAAAKPAKKAAPKAKAKKVVRKSASKSKAEVKKVAPRKAAPRKVARKGRRK